MASLVLYYSRSGTTASVAKALATQLGADIAEIECPRYRPGWFRYLRAGYDSVKGNLPPIVVPEMQLTNHSLVILGAPIWTSYPALPLRAFLSQYPSQGANQVERVAVFLTYGGHSSPQKAVDFVADRLPVKLAASLAVRQDAVRRGEATDAIGSFVEELRAKT